MQNDKMYQYWKLPEQEQEPPSDEEIRCLMIRAVEDRLLSDVSVGSYLSGGLDSTIIAALSNKLHTWTVGFQNNNEFNFAKIAANHIGSSHHEVNINYEEFIEIGRQMIKKDGAAFSSK